MWDILIDGETVKLEPVTYKNGKFKALNLVGPGTYSGHLHGLTANGVHFCIPKVKYSVAKLSREYCPEVPPDFRPPYFATFWVDSVLSDA